VQQRLLLAGQGSSVVVPSLITRLQGGTVASELFTLPNGINEFDILYDGDYHLFYSTYNNDGATLKTHHRQASTVAGLSSASDAVALAGKVVPTVIKVGTTWHMWCNDFTSTRTTFHYTASSPDGPFTLSDTVSGSKGDPHVRYRDFDGRWYMAYIGGSGPTMDPSNWRCGLMWASDPAGPWTDLGFTFTSKAAWYNLETDAAVIFVEGRVYMALAGLDVSDVQCCGMAEVDPSTWQATADAVILVSPTEAWEQRNGAHRVFNPVFEPQDQRFYFSHNPGYAGAWYSVTTGWSYLA